MLKRAMFTIISLIILTAVSGCSSIVARTFGENYTYYYGTQFDLNNISTDKPLSFIMLVDLPFSFVADTILTPVDAIFGPYCGIMSGTIQKENQPKRCQ